MALIDLVQIPDQAAPAVCAASGCEEPAGHCLHYYVAISHYRRDAAAGLWERSFIQVYKDDPACSHDHQLANGHARVDALANLSHGAFDEKLMNPDGTMHVWTDSQMARHRLLAEYHPNDGISAKNLPTMDAITGLALSNDIFVPHVGDANPTDHYQEILRRGVLNLTGQNLTVDQLTFGTATFENALVLAHRIIDEVLHPNHVAYHAALDARLAAAAESEVPAS